jgi:hypothetical protein
MGCRRATSDRRRKPGFKRRLRGVTGEVLRGFLQSSRGAVGSLEELFERPMHRQLFRVDGKRHRPCTKPPP